MSPITSEERFALEHAITRTDVAGYEEPYRGKVRDVYSLNDKTLAIVATDRISAFDHIMRQAIPFKGQILSSLAAYFFEHVDDIVETHVIAHPHPNVTIGKKCQQIPIEVVVRGYLTGHALRTYQSGLRSLCGVNLPEGMKAHEAFPQPMLTPATKATEGHDEDISEAEILSRGIVQAPLWEQIRTTAFRLFQRGQEMALQRGLILVDTKYEFGLYEGRLVLIDEVHTADSSRYFYADEYADAMAQQRTPKQLSKEFLREWLISKQFQGLEGQHLPDLSDEFRLEIYHRYKELYERLTGQPFQPKQTADLNTELAVLFSRYM